MKQANRSTVALNMIVKDELEKVTKILTQAEKYFDQINLVVSNKLTAAALADAFKNINVKHRTWNNRFDEARNVNFAMSTCDYNFWVDSDDSFDFSYIPKLVEIADSQKIDIVFLPYNYAQDAKGNCVAFQWRERLLRRSHPFVWKGWVHETPISDIPFKAHRENVPVIHLATADHVKESIERNHKILEEAVAKSDDPRYKMYLGTSYHSLGKYDEAIKILDEYLGQSGSAEDSYRVLTIMSECAWELKSPQRAIDYALKAAGLLPDRPEAYWLLAQWEAHQGNWEQGLEWIKTSEIKEDVDTLSVIDPTSRDRARLIAAECEFMQHNYNNALSWLNKVSDRNESKLDLIAGFTDEADAETFATLLPKMRKFFKNDAALWEALCYDMQYDNRLVGLRNIVKEPRIWSDKSIVILCGEGYEEWGPHTLDKGMGGSEEAVIYLSRELAKLGWKVVVYGAVDEPKADMVTGHVAVRYLPWKELDKRDKFNVFVAWRAPMFTELIDAKVKIADIHDILPKDQMKNYGDVKYFVKSNFHRNLYPELKDEKFKVIGNGICKEQFK